MIKRMGDSVIEVWGMNYINDPLNRAREDVDAEIVQIEVGNDGNYMVEVVRQNE